jgi:hypothetical protein
MYGQYAPSRCCNVAFALNICRSRPGVHDSSGQIDAVEMAGLRRSLKEAISRRILRKRWRPHVDILNTNTTRQLTESLTPDYVRKRPGSQYPATSRRKKTA